MCSAAGRAGRRSCAPRPRRARATTTESTSRLASRSRGGSPASAPDGNGSSRRNHTCSTGSKPIRPCAPSQLSARRARRRSRPVAPRSSEAKRQRPCSDAVQELGLDRQRVVGEILQQAALAREPAREVRAERDQQPRAGQLRHPHRRRLLVRHGVGRQAGQEARDRLRAAAGARAPRRRRRRRPDRALSRPVARPQRRLARPAARAGSAAPPPPRTRAPARARRPRPAPRRSP